MVWLLNEFEGRLYVWRVAVAAAAYHRATVSDLDAAPLVLRASTQVSS